MIDGETGERTIHTLVKTQDEVRENTARCWIYLTRSCLGATCFRPKSKCLQALNCITFIAIYYNSSEFWLHILQSCFRDVHKRTNWGWHWNISLLHHFTLDTKEVICYVHDGYVILLFGFIVLFLSQMLVHLNKFWSWILADKNKIWHYNPYFCLLFMAEVHR